MKKTLLLASLALSGFANAQITVTQNDVPVAGTFSVIANDSTDYVSEGLAGANRTWDFTSLKNQKSDTSRFITPLGAPDAANFPSSNLVLKKYDASSGGFFYGFAKVSATSLDLLGLSGTFNGIPVHPVYNPPVKVLTFPMTYNSAYSGKSKYVLTFAYPAAPADSIGIVSTISYSNLVDGWGSVATPSGTSNSLRLRKISNTIDSTFYHDSNTKKWIWDGKTLGNKTDTSYQWWANGKGNNVAEISLNGMSKPGKTGSYLLTVKTLTGLSEVKAGAEVSVFPNPSNGILNIRFESGTPIAIVEISNVLGERVLSNALNGTVSKIDVSKLPKGIYTYQIKNEVTVLKIGKVILE